MLAGNITLGFAVKFSCGLKGVNDGCPTTPPSPVPSPSKDGFVHQGCSKKAKLEKSWPVRANAFKAFETKTQKLSALAC